MGDVSDVDVRKLVAIFLIEFLPDNTEFSYRVEPLSDTLFLEVACRFFSQSLTMFVDMPHDADPFVGRPESVCSVLSVDDGVVTIKSNN